MESSEGLDMMKKNSSSDNNDADFLYVLPPLTHKPFTSHPSLLLFADYTPRKLERI
jgi:hypothetical protein